MSVVKDMMAQSWAESTWEMNNYGRYINQFPPNIIESIRQYERINKKICRQKMYIMFNKICIKSYILYIYMYKQNWALNELWRLICHETQSINQSWGRTLTPSLINYKPREKFLPQTYLEYKVLNVHLYCSLLMCAEE